MFEENLKNDMGLEFYNLSHRFGYQSPNWPYFEDVKIERIHYMAKSGVLSQRITTSMHNTTHIDAPAHVIQGTPFIDEVPLHPHLAEEYKKWSGGRDWKDDFPEWEPVHRILFKNGILGIENVGGDLDKVTGRRCTFAFFPWNWERGDGCIVRLVAMIDPKGAYRFEKGEKF